MPYHNYYSILLYNILSGKSRKTNWDWIWKGTNGLAYGNDVNLIGNYRTIEINADMLLYACKDIRLEENPGKSKYMEVGCRGVMTNEHFFI